jgi:hypothetical protein
LFQLKNHRNASFQSSQWFAEVITMIFQSYRNGLLKTSQSFFEINTSLYFQLKEEMKKEVVKESRSFRKVFLTTLIP